MEAANEHIYHLEEEKNQGKLAIFATIFQFSYIFSIPLYFG